MYYSPPASSSQQGGGHTFTTLFSTNSNFEIRETRHDLYLGHAKAIDAVALYMASFS